MNCYHCQTNINEYDLFCHNCGRDLINKCTNNQCDYGYISLKSTDKYCRLCGSETIFKAKGYIGVEDCDEVQASYNNPISDDDIPF